MTDKIILPEHVGIIMDGNGRWAKKRGLPRNSGHKKGAEVFENVSRYCRDIGIKYLTVYAFSTENWKRPKDEVEGIMNLMRGYLKNMANAKNEHIAVRFIGDRTPFDKDLLELMEEAENADVGEIITTVQIALNYGGRDEILKAAKLVANALSKGEISESDITEDYLSSLMYTKDVPELDLIIRPSGELRLSNFLLWQAAYAEFWFADINWPDFSEKDMERAVLDYQKRNRRFGKVQ